MRVYARGESLGTRLLLMFNPCRYYIKGLGEAQSMFYVNCDLQVVRDPVNTMCFMWTVICRLWGIQSIQCVLCELWSADCEGSSQYNVFYVNCDLQVVRDPVNTMCFMWTVICRLWGIQSIQCVLCELWSADCEGSSQYNVFYVNCDLQIVRDPVNTMCFMWTVICRLWGIQSIQCVLCELWSADCEGSSQYNVFYVNCDLQIVRDPVNTMCFMWTVICRLWGRDPVNTMCFMWTVICRLFAHQDDADIDQPYTPSQGHTLGEGRRTECTILIPVHIHVYTYEQTCGITNCTCYCTRHQNMFNPPPQFSRLGIQVSLACYICLFVWAMVGWVTLPFFSFCFLKLVCYVHVFPRTCTCSCSPGPTTSGTGRGWVWSWRGTTSAAAVSQVWWVSSCGDVSLYMSLAFLMLMTLCMCVSERERERERGGIVLQLLLQCSVVSLYSCGKLMKSEIDVQVHECSTVHIHHANQHPRPLPPKKLSHPLPLQKQSSMPPD